MSYEVVVNGNVKIGEQAPEFEAVSSQGMISLNDFKGKWLVFFSHPGDFTPVCTTEMIAFQRSKMYFDNLNTSLLGLSIDSNPSHLAWINDIYLRTGIKLEFPIIADRSGEIARKYGMISESVSNTQTVRNVYIIDDKGIIRVILIYPLNIGRFIPEILRLIQALQMSECEDAVTPANWIPGRPIIIRPPQTYAGLEERKMELEQNNNGMSWYLTYKEPSMDCMDKIKLSERTDQNEQNKQL